jgi:hypothetical protein
MVEEQRRRMKELEGIAGRTAFHSLAVRSLLNAQTAAAEAARNSLMHSAYETAVIAAQAHQGLLSGFKAAQSEAFKSMFGGINRSASEALAKAVAGVNAITADAAARMASAAAGVTAAAGTYRASAAAAALAVSSAQKESLAAINSMVAARKGALASMEAIASSARLESVMSAAKAIAEANKVDLTRLGAVGGSSGLAALDFSAFGSDINHLSALRTSFAGRLADILREEIEPTEQSNANLDRIEEIINKQVESLPQSRISAEGLIHLYLTILSVLIALAGLGITFRQFLDSGKISEDQQQLFTRLFDLTHKVVESTERLNPLQDTSIYYVVEREVALRIKPRTKSKITALLFPNQKVRLVQPSHQWIYVEYFDEIEAVPKYGWAYKKYLKRLASDHSRDWSSRHKPLTIGLTESLPTEERVAITSSWDQTNARRVELIHKKVKKSITPDEKRELENLQRLADERIRLIAPLPIKKLESLLENIKAEDK